MSWNRPACASHLLTEKHSSVTMEHLVQYQVSTSSFGCGTQPDGQKTKWRDHRWRWRGAQQSLLRNRCKGSMCHARSSSILNHGCWWCAHEHVHATRLFTPSTRLREERTQHQRKGDPWPYLGPQEEMGERLHWPSMFLGLQYVWRRYGAQVSCACFWNVCPSNTGINRYSASRCGLVRKLRRPSWSRTTLSCACLLCLSSRISLFCVSACRFCAMDTRLCSIFAAVFWTSSSWNTPSVNALQSSSPLDGSSQISKVRCTWMSVRSRRISFPASVAATLSLQARWLNMTFAMVRTWRTVSCTAAMLCTGISTPRWRRSRRSGLSSTAGRSWDSGAQCLLVRQSRWPSWSRGTLSLCAHSELELTNLTVVTDNAHLNRWLVSTRSCARWRHLRVDGALHVDAAESLTIGCSTRAFSSCIVISAEKSYQ